MDEKRKIDLQQHQLPKGKKWYLIKITFYILVLLAVLGYMWYQVATTSPAAPKEIEGVEIELN